MAPLDRIVGGARPDVLEESARSVPFGRAFARPPCDALRPFLAEIRIRASGPGGPDHVALPDGRVALVFRAPHPAVARPRDPGVFAVGTRRGLLRKSTTDTALTIALCFRPAGAAGFFGVPMKELTDRVLSLRDLWGGAAEVLSDRLAELAAHAAAGGATPDAGQESAIEASVKAIEQALLARRRVATMFERQAGHAAEMAHAARAAVQVMAGATAIPSVSALARHLGMSDRRLRRVFDAAVGLSPKAFARIIRLQRLLRAARHDAAPDWAALALRAGYYDQSHMIAECRRLTGMTPLALHADRAVRGAVVP